MEIKPRAVSSKGTPETRDKLELVTKDRGFVRRTFKNPGQERKPPKEGFHNPHARKFMDRVE